MSPRTQKKTVLSLFYSFYKLLQIFIAYTIYNLTGNKRIFMRINILTVYKCLIINIKLQYPLLVIFQLILKKNEEWANKQNKTDYYTSGASGKEEIKKFKNNNSRLEK
jgi:hypothetical protein